MRQGVSSGNGSSSCPDSGAGPWGTGRAKGPGLPQVVSLFRHFRLMHLGTRENGAASPSLKSFTPGHYWFQEMAESDIDMEKMVMENHDVKTPEEVDQFASGVYDRHASGGWSSEFGHLFITWCLQGQKALVALGLRLSWAFCIAACSWAFSTPPSHLRSAAPCKGQ